MSSFKHPSTDSSFKHSLLQSGDSILERLVGSDEDDLLDEKLEEAPVSSASTKYTTTLDELKAEPKVCSAKIYIFLVCKHSC